MNLIQILQSFVASFGWELQQCDIKNVFLHVYLDKKVYTDILPEFGLANGANKVCQLNMTLYGLEQSPHSWFGRFTKAMMWFGYNQNQRDHTLFLIHKEENWLYFLFYVDDIIVTWDDLTKGQLLKEKLIVEFEMKDLG